MSDGWEGARIEGALAMLVIIIIIISLIFWHGSESECQNKHNVADCEISVSFNPKQQEVE